MSWLPDNNSVDLIVNVLQNVQHPDTNVQREINKHLTDFKRHPEFNRYLLFILLHSPTIPEYIRFCAGIILKNNITTGPQISTQEQNFLKSAILQGISDPLPQIRNVTASIITTIISVSSIRSWPGILEYLVSSLDNRDRTIVYGAFLALERISEDHCNELNNELDGTSASNFLLPKFMEFFNHSDPELRKIAIGCVTKFIYYYPKVMKDNKDSFIEGYLHLCNDPEPSVRKRAVTALLLMTEGRIEDLRCYLPTVIHIILDCMQHTNEDLALEATEFWPIFVAHREICLQVGRPLLKQIFPVLLNKMIYSEQDLIDLGFDKEDSNVPDKPKDMKPTFTTPVKAGKREEIDDDDECVSNWNRKGAAEALDFLARVFRAETLPDLLPLLEQGLQSQADWKARESAILGLGCISKGCSRDLEKYLPQLVGYLFNLLRDPKPLIRSITCWTLGRYSHWIIRQQNREQYFDKLITELIERAKDNNKKVQKSAILSISMIVSDSGIEISPYTDQILNCFNNAFQYFQSQNLHVLYQAIEALSDALGSKLNNENFIRLILHPLLKKWENLSDYDSNLFPILECLSFVAMALGPGFVPYTKPIFERCLRLIGGVLNSVTKSSKTPDFEPLNSEFLLCSVDLLSGLCAGLKGTIEPLVTQSNLIPLIIEMCQYKEFSTSRSCYALIGDLSRYAPQAIIPFSSDLIHSLLNGVVFGYDDDSTNNAVWALGEIVMKAPKASVMPFAEKICSTIMGVFREGIEMETCALSLGRMAIYAPELIGVQLKDHGKAMCISLKNLSFDYDHDRDEALIGFLNAISTNPGAIIPCFKEFCDLIVSYDDPKPPLSDQFRNILNEFKNRTNPTEWQRVIDSFPEHIKRRLRSRYNV